MVDLEETQERPVDLVIATKFPSYAIRHPNKVVWLVHQFRQAYELDRAELGQFGERSFDRATVRAVHRLDRRTLGEAKRLFAISQNVADRLQRSTSLDAEVLPPPPQQLDYRSLDGDGEYILSVGRLDRAKRVDLLLEAAALDGSLRVVVAGEGPDRDRLERLASQHRLDGRVTFAGRVGDDELVDLYAEMPGGLLCTVRRGFRLRPLRGIPVGEACGDHTRRRRAARGRRRRRERARLRAGPGSNRRGVLVARGESRSGESARPCRQSRWPSA